MQTKGSGKSSRSTQFMNFCGFAISVVSISLALFVYFENRRVGSIEVYVPSRYGTLRGEHQSNKSDKILLCFTLHNDGNVFRNLTDIRLRLRDRNGPEWDLKAIGKLDELKELKFERKSLREHPNYSLVTSLSLDKNQFISLNLLFYYEDDAGWKKNGKTLKLKQNTYRGKIVVDSLEKDDNNGYRLVKYESDDFEFTLKYEPKKNLIDTFTEITHLRI